LLVVFSGSGVVRIVVRVLEEKLSFFLLVELARHIADWHRSRATPGVEPAFLGKRTWGRGSDTLPAYGSLIAGA
jgi:hypothetical protein